MNTDTEVEALDTASLNTRLQSAILEACVRLSDLIGKGVCSAEDLKSKFGPAVIDIDCVIIDNLDSAEGAFSVVDGTLTLDVRPVERILRIVFDDVRKQVVEGGRSLHSAEIFSLYERVLINYTLHELRHRTQGIEKYETVQTVKSAVGADLIATLDVLADRDAAVAYASVFSLSGSRASYLNALKQAWFWSKTYFFRAFPIPRNRPDKIARAISALLMAARLGLIDDYSTYIENPELPLDAPIVAKLESNNQRLVIMRAEPSMAILKVANDAAMVQDLVDDIVEGRFDDAYAASVRIVKKYGLV